MTKSDKKAEITYFDCRGVQMIGYLYEARTYLHAAQLRDCSSRCGMGS